MSIQVTQSKILRSLQNRSFALLWSGQTLSRFGDHLYEIALAWWVLEKTGSPGAMATVLIFAFGPTVIFSLVGGVLVDRYPRMRIMLVADIVRGLAALGVALLAMTGNLEVWQVYGLSLIFGLVEAFFQPAYAAAVPDMVPEEDLPSANSLTSLSIQFGRIAGPAAGAALVALGGVNLAFLVNAITFFMAAALLLPLMKPRASLHAESSGAPLAAPNVGKLFTEMADGVRTVTATPWLWISIAMYAMTNITLSGPYAISMPFLVNDDLSAGVASLGLLYALFATGYVIAGFWLGRKPKLRHRGRMIYIGTAVAGLMLLLFGLPIGFVGLAAAALVNGAALEMGGLAWTNSIQELVPREKLGRVASIDSFGTLALLPIGYGITGWATEMVGAQAVFLIGGGLTVVIALLGFCHPAVRSLN